MTFFLSARCENHRRCDPSFRAVLLAAGLFSVAAALSPCRAADPSPRPAPTRRVSSAWWGVLRQCFREGRPPEIVQMLWAVAHGSRMGPNEGWFHEGKSRYGWQWLARRYDKDRDGRITRKELNGPAELFDRLDRNRDGVLTADDFDWSDRSAFLRQNRPADRWFQRLDTNSNGRISRAEWEAFFTRAARGKKYLTPEDFRAALTQTAPKPSGPVKGGGGPSPLIFIRGLLSGELGSYYEGPAVGQQAPDFTLPTHDGKGKVNLAQLRGKKPVVLVFGSFT